MAIKISNLKLPVKHTDNDLKGAAARRLKVSTEDILSIKKLKCSLDARKKDNITYIYSIAAVLKNEKAVLRHLHGKDAAELYKEKPYSFKPSIEASARDGRIIVTGCGPAGLFCAYELAKAGFAPLVIDRGAEISERVQAVRRFWNGEKLDIDTNVQFGEGGAGTFSDGKLNTAVKDSSGRIAHVLETFVRFGAPEEILYNNKPHIGTDLLKDIVFNMRCEIEKLGGEVRFNTKLTDIAFHGEMQRHITVTVNNNERISCSALVLAVGHSARDTFYMLRSRGIYMEPKPFAVGVRVEHPQELIGRAQYGDLYSELPAADYKLTYKCRDGRGVYSFCMCPGGFVVNASSEEGMLVVNGMSNSGRDEAYANSAIVVTVAVEDFGGSSDNPLGGVEFQRKLEKLAFAAGNGRIPVQLYRDFAENTAASPCSDKGIRIPNTAGAYSMANLRDVLPDYICNDIVEAMQSFGRTISGFDGDEALLLGVETRTSSPVRLTRDSSFMSVSHPGIYPCGEGAGYAGGITSAAVDGIKVFERLVSGINTEE